jgi:hypothetical protein
VLPVGVHCKEAQIWSTGHKQSAHASRGVALQIGGRCVGNSARRADPRKYRGACVTRAPVAPHARSHGAHARPQKGIIARRRETDGNTQKPANQNHTPRDVQDDGTTRRRGRAPPAAACGCGGATRSRTGSHINFARSLLSQSRQPRARQEFRPAFDASGPRARQSPVSAAHCLHEIVIPLIAHALNTVWRRFRLRPSNDSTLPASTAAAAGTCDS